MQKTVLSPVSAESPNRHNENVLDRALDENPMVCTSAVYPSHVEDDFFQERFQWCFHIFAVNEGHSREGETSDPARS